MISQTIPTHTANGEFAYSRISPWGKSLDELVQIVHRKLSEASGWDYRPLTPGQFGYDNMVMSIGRVCTSLRPSSLQNFSEMVHQGWVDNYCYWRDYEPWATRPVAASGEYFKPYNPLGDERRNALAAQSFSDLPEEEKKKDELIAQTLLDIEANVE